MAPRVVLPCQLLHSVKSPFFGRGMMMPFLQSAGTCSSCQTMLHTFVKWGTAESAYFISSDCMLSTPAAFPFFNCLIANLTSFSEKGSTLIGSCVLASVSSATNVIVGSGQLRTDWKCSFHLFTNSSWVPSSFPSASFTWRLCGRWPVSSFTIL